MHFAIFPWSFNLKQKQEKSYPTISLFLNFLKQFDWWADSTKKLKMDFLPRVQIFSPPWMPAPHRASCPGMGLYQPPTLWVMGLWTPAPFPSPQFHFWFSGKYCSKTWLRSCPLLGSLLPFVFLILINHPLAHTPPSLFMVENQRVWMLGQYWAQNLKSLLSLGERINHQPQHDFPLFLECIWTDCCTTQVSHMDIWAVGGQGIREAGRKNKKERKKKNDSLWGNKLCSGSQPEHFWSGFLLFVMFELVSKKLSGRI